jgi:catechol 2,3-dioxygenase-like lactoylglutathione lyase family enzyme
VGYIPRHGGFAMLYSSAPFFIVDDLGATLAFYQSKLGFDVLHKGGGDGDGDDFWAILVRDRAMLFFKAITPEIHSRILRVTNGLAGTPTSARMIPTHCTQSS